MKLWTLVALLFVAPVQSTPDWVPADPVTPSAWTYLSSGWPSSPQFLPIPWFIDSSHGVPRQEFVDKWLQATQAWDNVSTSRIAYSYQGLSIGPFNVQVGVADSYSPSPWHGATRVTLVNDVVLLTGFWAQCADSALQPYEHELGHGLGLDHYPGQGVMANGIGDALGPADIAGSTGLHPVGNERPVGRLVTTSPTFGVGPMTVILNAGASTDSDGGIAWYRFDFGDNSSVTITTSSVAQHTYRAPSGMASVTYRPSLMVADDKGGIAYAHVGSPIDLLVLAAPDTTPPTTPGNLRATAGDGLVTLQWSPSTEAISLPIRYLVYRRGPGETSFRKISDQVSDYLTCADRNVTSGLTYDYYVTAKDRLGNESAPSAVVRAAPRSSVPVAPFFQFPQPIPALVEGKTTVLSISAYDANLDDVYLQMSNQDGLAQCAWTWGPTASGSGATGTLTLTPAAGMGGQSYRFALTATDSTGLSSSTTLMLGVAPPLFISMMYGDTNGWYGQSRSQRAVVVNQSGYSTPAGTFTALMVPDLPGSTLAVLAASLPFPSLAPGASTVINYTFAIPSTWPTNRVNVIPYVQTRSTWSYNASRVIGLTQNVYDVNGDGVVNVIDISAITDVFGTRPGDLMWNSSADVTRDGVVNVIDLSYETDAVKGLR